LALFRGNRSDVDAVLIPAIIDSIIIIPSTTKRDLGRAVTTSKYAGVGRPEVSKNYTSDVSVYDPESRDLLFEVAGIHYHQLEVLGSSRGNETFCRTQWKPDIAYLSGGMLNDISVPNQEDPHTSTINQLIDMVAHKTPSLRVLEVNMSAEDQTSIWLEGDFDKQSRAAYKEYTFASSDPAVLMNAEEKWTTNGNTKFDLTDLTRPLASSQDSTKFDLMLIKLVSGSSPSVILSEY
jgi:hypothetical protein